MCFACETPDFAGFGFDDALLARARRIDARSPGRAVSETAWSVLSGRQQTHVAWPELRRALTMLERAENDLCGRLVCEAVP